MNPGAVPYPHSFDGHPILYAFVVWGLLTCTLLCMEWLWRLIWSCFERPLPMKHPATVVRLILVFLLASMLMRVGPDVLTVMLYGEVGQSTLNNIEHFDRIMDGLSAFPMLVAWFWGLIGLPMIAFQLLREPLPINLWPTARQAMRPLKMGFIVLGIALAVTFLR